jgi:membrane-associated phospholipid phosphatase
LRIFSSHRRFDLTFSSREAFLLPGLSYAKSWSRALIAHQFPVLTSLIEYVAGSVVLLSIIAAVYARTGRSMSIASGAAACAVLLGGMAILATASYVAAARSPFPMMDGALEAADRWLHFDWAGWTAWGRAHPWIWRAQVLAYDAMHPELALLVLYLGLRERATPLIVSLFVGGVIAIVVSWFVPAIGHLPDAPHVPVLLALRTGALPDGVPQGLISFPSYHTTVAILLTAALFRERFLFLVACVLNGAMVISTLSMGGHYLVDVLAGIVVAAAGLYLGPRLVPTGFRSGNPGNAGRQSRPEDTRALASAGNPRARLHGILGDQSEGRLTVHQNKSASQHNRQ